MHGWTGDVQLSEAIYPALAFIVVGSFCNAALQIPYMLQLSHSWTTLSVRINLMAVLLLAPSVYIGVNEFGIVGAAAAWAAVNLMVFGIGTIAMHQRLLPDERAQFLKTAISMPLLVSFSAVGAFTLFLPEDMSRIAGGLFSLSAAGIAAVTTAAVTTIGRKAWRELLISLGF